jgi:hypothetical protein
VRSAVSLPAREGPWQPSLPRLNPPPRGAVPPVVLLAATHGNSALVSARLGCAIYWAALAMTLALAPCGSPCPSMRYGRWPQSRSAGPGSVALAVRDRRRDRASNPCLLSLSRARRRRHRRSPIRDRAPAVDVPEDSEQSDEGRPPNTDAALPVHNPDIPDSAGGGAEPVAQAATLIPDMPEVDDAAVLRWSPITESLVCEDVTSKNAEVVAAILAQREAGMPPSAIGRTHRVHHTTVGRILSAAESLTGSSGRPRRAVSDRGRCIAS